MTTNGRAAIRRGRAGGGTGRGEGDDFPAPEGRSAAALLTPYRDERMERVVLACIILRWEDAWPYVEGRVGASDFYDPRHRAIFEAIEALIAQQKPIDMHTLTTGLGSRLDAVGGASYIDDLCGDVSSVAYIETYVRDLAEAGTIRAVQDVAVKTLLAVGTRPAAEVLAVAAEMRAAMEARGKSEAFTAIDDALVMVMSRIEAGAVRGGRIGRTFGLRELDILTGGATNGQLVVIAARPAMGKTSLAIEAMTAMAEESKARGDQGVYLFFSCEMPRIEIAQRQLCQVARVDESRVRQIIGLTPDDSQALGVAANALAGLPVHVTDGIDTIQEINAACYRAKLKYGAVLGIFIDYLQLLKDLVVRARRGNYSREQEIAEVAKALKKLAKELDCPLIALAQLSRECEKRADKRPMLSDLRESGEVEQSADVVMFIYRDEVYNKNSEDRGIAEIIVGKQRSGPTDTVRTRFVRACTLFEDLVAKDDGSEAPYAAGGYGRRKAGAASDANDDAPFGPDDALPPYQE